MEYRLYTSESVTEGHPDKICDQISDAILDAVMKQDPYGRVACEACVNTDFVLVMGEMTTKAKIDIPALVRKTVVDIGYTKDEYGFNGNTCEIQVRMDSQSGDISMGVDHSLEEKNCNMVKMEAGAGDQGMMYGYATDETEVYMPYPIVLAHQLTKQLAKVRKEGILPYLRPDTKVDRSAAYYARYVAKNIVAAGLAKRCEVQVSYAIGVATPTSVNIDTFGTGTISDRTLGDFVKVAFDFRPSAIIDELNLRQPIYKQTASYGHFGREDLELKWEKLDKAEFLKRLSKHIK